MLNIKLSAYLLTIVGLSLGVIAIPAIATAPAEHSHGHTGAPTALTLDAGKKWATDTPLRQAMTNVRNAVSESLPAIHSGKFSAAEYDALATKVNGEVNYMVGNCKLQPAADAQLHLVIARMLEGVAAMEGKTSDTKRQQGVVNVIGALNDYSIYFDHPGWLPVKH